MRDDGEAEDALQNAYFKAFRTLAEFRGEAMLTTWLSRIVMHECLQRQRGARAQISATIAYEPAIEALPFPESAMQANDPEKPIAQRELLHHPHLAGRGALAGRFVGAVLLGWGQ